VRLDFLPLHAFGGRALGVIRASTASSPGRRRDGGRPYRRRRDPLVPAPGDRPAASRALRQPVPRPARPHGHGSAVLDSRTPDCTWHRCSRRSGIRPAPPRVLSRAANEVEQLESVRTRPNRPRTCGRRAPSSCYAPARPPPDGGTPAGLGTWERCSGGARRYLQVKLVLEGDGRGSPDAAAARVYYPRVSYVGRPARRCTDDAGRPRSPALAGELRGVQHRDRGLDRVASRLFRPCAPRHPRRSIWLAGWLVCLSTRCGPDPGTAHADRPDRDERVPRDDVRTARARQAAAVHPVRTQAVRTARDPRGDPVRAHPASDPCLEDTLEAFPRGHPSVRALRAELQRHGLSMPNPASREDELEDLLYAYVLRPPARRRCGSSSSSRLRDGRALRYATPEAQP
jgi:hypothetical protein